MADLTITTDAPAVAHFREITVGDGDTFAADSQAVVDAVPPIAVRPTQVHRNEVPFGAPAKPDSHFGLFAIDLKADAGGQLVHTFAVDGSPTLHFELDSQRGRRSTLPATVKASDTIFIWATDNASSFPD
jgi:hypothetical protein